MTVPVLTPAPALAPASSSLFPVRDSSISQEQNQFIFSSRRRLQLPSESISPAPASNFPSTLVQHPSIYDKISPSTPPPQLDAHFPDPTTPTNPITPSRDVTTPKHILSSHKSPESIRTFSSPREKLRRAAANHSVDHKLKSSPASPYTWAFPSPEHRVARQQFSVPVTVSESIADLDAAAAALPIQKSATGEITGITPARLVILITAPDAIDYDFLSDVCLCFRQFMSTATFLRLLAARFKWAINRADDIGRTVRLRTFVVLRHWILNYFPHDFLPSYSLRAAFVSVIHKFSSYGKVRASTGDRRLLGELKRCWIRLSCLYWDATPSLYRENVFSLTCEACFNEIIFPGGDLGSRDPTPKTAQKIFKGRHAKSIKRVPVLEGAGIIWTSDSVPASSPILRRLNGQEKAESPQNSVPSLSSGSIVSSEGPSTPIQSESFGQLWGSIIRGEAVVSPPRDEQAIVDSITPPSPSTALPRVSKEAIQQTKYKSQAETRGLMRAIRKTKSFVWDRNSAKPHSLQEPVPPLPNSRSSTRISSDRPERIKSFDEGNVRIDILAASVIDNYKQMIAQSERDGSTIDSRTSIESEPETDLDLELRSSSGFQSDGVGLGFQDPDLTGRLQSSPSRIARPQRSEDNDVESVYGTEVHLSDGVPEFSPYLDTNATTPLSYNGIDETERNSPQKILDFNNLASEGLEHFPTFPSSDSPSRSSDASSTRRISQMLPVARGLRRQLGRNDLKHRELSGSIGHSVSNSSSSVGSVLGGGEVTAYNPQLGIHVNSFYHSPVGIASSRRVSSRSTKGQLGIPGIPDDQLEEIFRLAELPDQAFDPNVDPVTVALMKLEGRPGPTKTSTTRHLFGFRIGADDSSSIADSSSLLRMLPNREEMSIDNISSRPACYSQQSSQQNNSRLSSIDGRQSRSYESSSLVYSHSESRSLDLSYSESMPASTVSLRIHLPFILKYRACDLAEQFTLIDRDALAEIDWKELIDLQWSQNVAPIQDWLPFITSRSVRGVEFIIARFNLMTSWVTSEVLLTRGLDERVRTLTKFIHIADHTRKLQNYSTFMQITLALASPTLQRLSSTWNSLSQEDRELFDSLESLASPLKNFKNLRQELDEADIGRGVVPFVGLYLSDLTFNALRPSSSKKSTNVEPIKKHSDKAGDTERNNQIYSEVSTLINLDKFLSASRIIKKLLYFINSSSAYDGKIHADTDLIARCLYVSCLDDAEIDECFRLLEHA
ncbi:ras guanine nucleotide exchange factor domain-containing protein [Lipomyces oligophaga]|uniref:ras guanine nucleotide exchange factor domain-containing protein n=1 Tax=Lipomyces oligophaga TaxID=45792 RepID=UPI0034CD9AE5